MMTYFMGHHISLRKISGLIITGEFGGILFPTNPHLSTHIFKECGIDINFLVCRTVERPHRRLSRTTTRIHNAIEQNQFRGNILLI